MSLPKTKGKFSEKLQKSNEYAFSHFAELVKRFCAAVTSGNEIIFERYSQQTKKEEILNMMTVKFITNTNDWFFREINTEKIVVYMCNDPKNEPTSTIVYSYERIDGDLIEIMEISCE